MARSRNIKPGFFKNEILGVADPLYSLLFEGLWTLADREGRLEDRPLRIKAEIFPYRDGINADEMLGWLEENDFILRYTVHGTRYIQVLNFLKHQNPHKHEPASEIPAPFGDGCETVNDGSYTANVRSRPADSLNLIPDSLNTDSKGAAKAELAARFARFWSAYPRKVSKPDAERAFKKLNPDDELLEVLLKAIEGARLTEQWLAEGGKFIPHPATWLNKRRWEDEGVDAGKPKKTFEQMIAEGSDAAG